MTVKELCDLLDPATNGQLPVVVRCQWYGESPAHNQFDIQHTTRELETDTGEEVFAIECKQDGG